jgi:hypothetical protein
LQRLSLIVGQGVGIPVVDDGLIYVFVETFGSVHCTIFKIMCKDSVFSAHRQKKCAVFYCPTLENPVSGKK